MNKKCIGTICTENGENERYVCDVIGGEYSFDTNYNIIPKIKGLKINFEFSEDDNELGYNTIFSVIKDLNKNRVGFKMEVKEQLYNTIVVIKTVEI